MQKVCNFCAGGGGGGCGQTLCDSGAVADISTPDQEGATRILTSLNQHLQTSHGERTSRQGAGGEAGQGIILEGGDQRTRGRGRIREPGMGGGRIRESGSEEG